jgi:hypothetical protein
LTILASLKTWARAIKRDVVAVYFVARDAATPWHIRVLAFLVRIKGVRLTIIFERMDPWSI